jgi:hypothetical protein
LFYLGKRPAHGEANEPASEIGKPGFDFFFMSLWLHWLLAGCCGVGAVVLPGDPSPNKDPLTTVGETRSEGQPPAAAQDEQSVKPGTLLC